MAMTQAQVTAELKRKASLGIAPKDPSNQAQYNQIKSSMNTTPTGVQTNPNQGTTAPKSSVSSGVVQNPSSALPTSITGGENFSSNNSGSLNLNKHEDTLQPNTISPMNGINSSSGVVSSDGGSVNLNTGNTIVDPAEQEREKLKRAMLANRIASLDKAKNNALSSLDDYKAGIQPTYYNKRNQAAANNDIATMNFAQFMAARGIKGNAGAMPDIYRNSSLQGQIGALDQAEAQDMERVERDRFNINKNYEYDVANANADVETQSLQNQLNQMNLDRAYNLQAENQKFNQNMATNQYNSAKVEQERDNYANTLGRFSGDFQSEINRVKADNDPTNDWQLAYLEAARQQKVKELESAQKAAEEKAKTLQSQDEKTAYANALALWKTAGVANDEISQVLGVPKGAKTADYNLDSMETQYQIKKPYYSPNVESNNTKGQLTYKDMYNSVLDLMGKKGPLGNSLYDNDYIKNMIINSTLSADQAAQLINQLGL